MRYKRKTLNLSVKKQLQLWLLFRIFGVVVLSSLVAVLVLYFYSREEISSSFYMAHIRIRRVSDLLLPVMATGSLVSLISGMVLALFLPQKIAGPIYRIERTLAGLRDGNLLERATLRRNDTLMDLADAVNETAAGLREKVQAVKDAQAELELRVAALGDELAVSAMARQQAALERLRTR